MSFTNLFMSNKSPFNKNRGHSNQGDNLNANNSKRTELTTLDFDFENILKDVSRPKESFKMKQRRVGQIC